MKLARGLGVYLAWQLPGWLVGAAAVAWLVHAFELPLMVAVVVLGLYIVKDLVLFPVVRGIFHPPASEKHIGATGVAVEPLEPTGYISIAGELWKAMAAGPSPSLAAGTRVVVREARGLTLLVEAEAPAAKRRGATRAG